MVANTAREARTPLLPSGSGLFFARRLREAAGLALVALALVIGAALITYSATDPSFNSAAGDATGNLFGRPGSHGADLLLQWLGLAAGLLPLILGAWAWALVSHRGLSRRLARLALAPLAVLLAAVGCASFGLAEWPTGAGAGGAVGGMVLSALGSAGLDIAGLGADTGIAAAGIGALFLIAAVLALLGALGVPWREWRVLFQGVYWGLRLGVRGALCTLRWVHGRAGEARGRRRR